MTEYQFIEKFKPIAFTRWLAIAGTVLLLFSSSAPSARKNASREVVSLSEGRSFYRYDPKEKPDPLIYDIRPEITDRRDDWAADSRPTEAVPVEASHQVLKPWILPSANPFIKDPAKRHARPAGSPGADFPFVQTGFNDSAWEKVDLPHDWGSEAPSLPVPKQRQAAAWAVWPATVWPGTARKSTSPKRIQGNPSFCR